jgi:excisionase family DNA binding protein
MDETATGPHPIYTLTEAAELTGLATSTIAYAARSGQLRAAKVGGRWRIALVDLAEWRAHMIRPPAGSVAPERLYRVTEAARLLDVTEQAIRHAVAHGRLSAVETPAGRRLLGADLLGWAPQRRRPAVSAVAAAAAATGVARETIRLALQRGEIRAEKIDGLWRIDPDALAAWEAKPKGRPRGGHAHQRPGTG